MHIIRCAVALPSVLCGDESSGRQRWLSRCKGGVTACWRNWWVKGNLGGRDWVDGWAHRGEGGMRLGICKSEGCCDSTDFVLAVVGETRVRGWRFHEGHTHDQETEGLWWKSVALFTSVVTITGETSLRMMHSPYLADIRYYMYRMIIIIKNFVFKDY